MTLPGAALDRRRVGCCGERHAAASGTGNWFGAGGQSAIGCAAHPGARLMLGNSLLLAIREIRRNAMRSFLTILGVVIGELR